MRWLRTILALMPCGKPQAAHFAHLVELLQWLPGRINFTGLEHYGGWSVRTHARWFGRPFPFARLAVAAGGAGGGARRGCQLRVQERAPDLGHGLVWERHGPRRPLGAGVTLLAAVDVEEGGAYPLCVRPSPGAVRARRQTCGAATGRETTVDAALALLREAVAAGAQESLGTRWVAADGGYAHRTFVEGVRTWDLHAVGRLRKDAVRRWSCTGPHERRPPRPGAHDLHGPGRRAGRPPPRGAARQGLAVLAADGVRPAARADPQTKEGMLRDGTDRELAPERLFRIYGARFPIAFAFREAKQHLGLNDCQARSQAGLHFHFNMVFAALFRARRQARLRAERPLGPFSLRHRKRHNLEAEIHQRMAARSAAGRNAANAEAGRGRIPPERLWRRAPPLASGPAGP
ncbi:MAG: transposase [Caldilineaceae bacterium]|nr:transposase [Caldilineaceae bacterium]